LSASVVPGLNRRVRNAVYDHVFAHDDHEVGGVLVGWLGDGTLPVVTGSIAALEADGQRASVTFTHDAWATIHATMEREFRGQQIVGWYHSHPGFGIFLSTYDRFIHDNFFSEQRQVAYVVDPQAGTEGVFGWRADELVLLSEGPAGRVGTSGARRARAEARTRLWYGSAAAALIALLALIVVLQTSGSKTAGAVRRPPSNENPRRFTSATSPAAPTLRLSTPSLRAPSGPHHGG
jgi:proteasome lid subunit RPN8/RPN11